MENNVVRTDDKAAVRMACALTRWRRPRVFTLDVCFAYGWNAILSLHGSVVARSLTISIEVDHLLLLLAPALLKLIVLT